MLLARNAASLYQRNGSMIVTPVNLTAVRQILSVEAAATERTGGSDDSAVPIRESVCRLDFQRAGQDRQRDVLNRKAAPYGDQSCCNSMSQPPRSRRSGRLNIEFLEDLD